MGSMQNFEVQTHLPKKQQGKQLWENEFDIATYFSKLEIKLACNFAVYLQAFFPNYFTFTLVINFYTDLKKNSYKIYI